MQRNYCICNAILSYNIKYIEESMCCKSHYYWGNNTFLIILNSNKVPIWKFSHYILAWAKPVYWIYHRRQDNFCVLPPMLVLRYQNSCEKDKTLCLCNHFAWSSLLRHKSGYHLREACISLSRQSTIFIFTISYQSHNRTVNCRLQLLVGNRLLFFCLASWTGNSQNSTGVKKNPNKQTNPHLKQFLLQKKNCFYQRGKKLACLEMKAGRNLEPCCYSWRRYKPVLGGRYRSWGWGWSWMFLRSLSLDLRNRCFAPAE